ncbi:hypothetical protein [Marinilabilia sp.]|uniref:hypothetical protein n=1 Tax=Marinilabilia sp. TaxID=2021252 RepID=UPI0025BA51F3|nr:hypothetical protein [Marinilabilia sp.]
MKKIFFVSLLLLIVSNVFGTRQLPDFIIIEGDTVFLFNYPLEEVKNPTVKTRIDSFVRNYYTPCSGCYRGYQATWQLKSEKLYLNEIRECCYLKRYWITSSNLDSLKKEGIPEIMLQELYKVDSNKSFMNYELKDFLNKKFKRKLVKKYLPIIYEVTKDKEAKVSAGLLLAENAKCEQVLADWYSGTLYFEYKDLECVFIIKNGEVVDKNAF